MAKQSIGLGSSANDGTGSTLRAGGDLINDNFDEIYTALGSGTALQITIAGASNGQVLTYSSSNSRFEPGSGGLTDIVGDTTPQLGGDLDVNGADIVSVSNGNINITPNGSGRVVLDGLSYPSGDGSAAQFLQTNGSGDLSFATALTDIVADTSPQLGANLDLNDYDIIGTGDINITGTIALTSSLKVASLTTTQRNALTAANGMIIYNSTDNKFQGYENGGWANLI
jgi:hypothetical protein